jgi:hypothetical protein
MSKFTIRELVLLTLVVAMGMGWWVHSSAKTAKIGELTEQQRKAEWKLATLTDMIEVVPGNFVVDEGGWEIRLIVPDANQQRHLEGASLEDYIRTGINPYKIPRKPRPTDLPLP